MSVLRPAAPISPVEVDGENEYFVERIDDIKYNKRKRQYIYLMKWKGFTKSL